MSKTNPHAMPAGVGVGPWYFEIKSDELTRLRRERASRSTLFGQTVVKDLLIMIDEQSAPSIQQETLLHEVMHALFATLGLDYEWENDEEEKFIRRFSPALLNLIQRNPALIRYLQADLS